MAKKVHFSIVVPVFNEEKNLPLFYQTLTRVLEKEEKDYELIFIDDGSTDSSLEILKKIGSSDKKVKIVSLRRNYGKSTALDVGFREAIGEIIITLDADLQDRPDQIPKFFKKLSLGYDFVCGWRYNRHDPLSKKIASLVFNRITAFLTNTHLHDMNCGFKAFRKEVVESLNLYGELHRFVPVLCHWSGFKIGEIKIKHNPRRFGKSKFGSGRYLSGFFDLLTVMFLTRYFGKPLHIFGLIGLLSFLFGASIIFFFEARKYLVGILIGAGRPIIQIAVFLMIFGVQVFIFGFLAELIISGSGKDRKIFIKEKIG